MNYRYEVKTKGDPKWYGNGIVLPERRQAEQAAYDKYCAWTLVEQTRVVATDAPANYRYVDGELLAIKASPAPNSA